MKTPESATDNNAGRKTPEAGKDTNVLRKTPDETKKGLECCKLSECERCPYNPYVYCGKAKNGDDLAYIQWLESTYSQVSKALCGKENATLDEVLQSVDQLKSRLAQVERERDAALNALRDVCGFCKSRGFQTVCEICLIKDYRPQNTKEASNKR